MCAGGWNAYANSANQGELKGPMVGAGRATVVYRDCWSSGFVGLYVNGELLDKTEENNAVQKTFRWCSGSVPLFLCAISNRKALNLAH